MAGYLLFFSMDLGKEGSASHWCTYCDTPSALWKKYGSIEGQPWTLEKLNEHLKRLESGELNKIHADEQKGVSSEALFDFVDIDHCFIPNLHLMLGIVNYLYKKMVEEAQADCEGYSLDFVEAERIWKLSKYDAATAKTNKKTFQARNEQYERQLQRGIRGDEDEEQQYFMEAELELLAEERGQMILEDEK